MNTTQDHPETALDVAKRRADELAQQWAGFDASFAVGAKEEEKDVPAVVIKSAEILILFAHFNTDFFARHDKIREAWRRGRGITGLLDKNTPLPTIQDQKEVEAKSAQVMSKLLELEVYLKETRVQLEKEEGEKKAEEERKAKEEEDKAQEEQRKNG